MVLPTIPVKLDVKECDCFGITLMIRDAVVEGGGRDPENYSRNKENYCRNIHIKIFRTVCQ